MCQNIKSNQTPFLLAMQCREEFGEGIEPCPIREFSWELTNRVCGTNQSGFPTQASGGVRTPWSAAACWRKLRGVRNRPSVGAAISAGLKSPCDNSPRAFVEAAIRRESLWFYDEGASTMNGRTPSFHQTLKPRPSGTPEIFQAWLVSCPSDS